MTATGLGFGLHGLLVKQGVALAPAGVSRAAVEVPAFGQPGERVRYLSAMIAGDRRALEVLTRGIAEARAQAQPDLVHIAGLERARSERAVRLADRKSVV